MIRFLHGKALVRHTVCMAICKLADFATEIEACHLNLSIFKIIISKVAPKYLKRYRIEKSQFFSCIGIDLVEYSIPIASIS